MKTLTRRSVLLLAIAALHAVVMAAQTHPATGPIRFAPDRLARIDAALQRYVDENRLAGVVGLVLRDGKPVYERAVGWSDREAGRKMTADTIFRIASQSKAITSVAILALMEEGRLGLTDPAGRYIPGFAKTMVAVQSGSG